MGKGGGLTRRDFLKSLGAGLALTSLLPGPVRMSFAQTECPVYKGVAPTDFDYTDGAYSYTRPFHDQWLDEIKELGADTVEINIPVKVKPDGRVGYNYYDEPYWLPPSNDRGTEENIKDYVRRAQEKGFKVILDIPSIMRDQSIDSRFNLDRFFEEFEELSLKWAEIAEEMGVEGYCPEGELGAIEYLMGLERTQPRTGSREWVHSPRAAAFVKQLIPKVRQKYSGLIIAQENPYQYPDFEFDGADYIGLHIHSKERRYTSRTPAIYRTQIREDINAGKRAAQRDGCKLMITELTFGCMPTPDYGCGGYTVVNEQQQKELCETAFKEIWGKVDGIFIWSWGDEPEFNRTGSVTGKPAEDVVRRYYQSCPATPPATPPAGGPSSSRVLDPDEYRVVYDVDGTFLRLQNVREPENAQDALVTVKALVNGQSRVITDVLDIVDGRGTKDIRLGSLFDTITVEEVAIEY